MKSMVMIAVLGLSFSAFAQQPGQNLRNNSCDVAVMIAYRATHNFDREFSPDALGQEDLTQLLAAKGYTAQFNTPFDDTKAFFAAPLTLGSFGFSQFLEQAHCKANGVLISVSGHFDERIYSETESDLVDTIWACNRGAGQSAYKSAIEKLAPCSKLVR